MKLMNLSFNNKPLYYQFSKKNYVVLAVASILTEFVYLHKQLVYKMAIIAVNAKEALV